MIKVVKKNWLVVVVVAVMAVVMVVEELAQEPSAPAPIAQEAPVEKPLAQEAPVPAPIAQEAPAPAPIDQEAPVEEPAEPPQPGVSGILEREEEKKGKLILMGVEERIGRELFVLSFELPPGAYIFAPFDGLVYYYSYKGSSVKVIKVEKEGLVLWIFFLSEYDPWENKKGEEGTEIKKGEVIAKTTNTVKIEIWFDSQKEFFDISILRKFFPYMTDN